MQFILQIYNRRVFKCAVKLQKLDDVFNGAKRVWGRKQSLGKKYIMESKTQTTRAAAKYETKL